MRSARAGVVRGAVVLAVVVLFAIPLRGGEPLGWGIAHGQTIPVGGGGDGGGGGGPAGPTIREEPGPTPPLQVVEVILTPPGTTLLGDGQVLGPQSVPTLSAGVGGTITAVAPADCVGPQVRGIVTQGG